MTQKTIPQEIAEIEAALTAARTVASGATADESVQVAMATISNSVGSALTVMYRLSLQIDALGEGMEALHGQVEGVIDVMPARRATGGTLDEIRAGAGSPEPQPVVVSAAPPPDAAAAPVDTGPTEFLKPLNFQFGGRTEFATIRYKRWLRHSAKAVLIVASDGNEYWVPNKMCVFDLTVKKSAPGSFPAKRWWIGESGCPSFKLEGDQHVSKKFPTKRDPKS